MGEVMVRATIRRRVADGNDGVGRATQKVANDWGANGLQAGYDGWNSSFRATLFLATRKLAYSVPVVARMAAWSGVLVQSPFPGQNFGCLRY